MGEVNQKQSEREIDYLYGNYSGQSPLDKKIKAAEKILNRQKEMQEENLEALYAKENLERLKKIPIKDMSWEDVQLFAELRKGDVDKVFIESGQGLETDTASLKSQIISAANELVPLVQSQGVSVQAIPEDSDMQTVLAFVNSIRDALKNSKAPKSGIEIDEEPSPYTEEELLTTKAEIERLLKKFNR